MQFQEGKTIKSLKNYGRLSKTWNKGNICNDQVLIIDINEIQQKKKWWKKYIKKINFPSHRTKILNVLQPASIKTQVHSLNGWNQTIKAHPHRLQDH